MRILLIDVNCKHSSTGTIVYDLFQYVREQGDAAAVCYGRGPFIKEPGIYKFGLDWETCLHAGMARVTGYNGYFSPLSTKRLLGFIRKFQPDIIHIHELHAYFVNLAPLLCYIQRNGIRLICTFHCEYMYTGKCGHAYECSKFKTECGQCPRLRSYPKSLFWDHTRQMFQAKKRLLFNMDVMIVCPSRWLADRVKQSFLKEKDITVIFNGVDTNTFYPRAGNRLKQKLGIPEKNKIVLSAAPDILSDTKGGRDVLALAERYGADVTFILAGAGNTKGRCSENVLLFPLITDKNFLAGLYATADVFLLCSKRETFSMTCAEALCCGTRVAGYRCGAPETVFTSEYAVFTGQGDKKSLKRQLDRMLDQDWDQRKRNTCAALSAKMYGSSCMAEHYFELYKSILRDQESRGGVF